MCTYGSIGARWRATSITPLTHSQATTILCVSKTVDVLQPDVIAVELPRGNAKHYMIAAGSRQLQPLLDRLMTTPLWGIAHAITLLLTGEEREHWARGLDEGKIKIGDRHKLQSHYVHGNAIVYSELISGNTRLGSRTVQRSTNTHKHVHVHEQGKAN